MKIDWQKHPNASKKSVNELEEEIFLANIDHGALAMRGSWFVGERDKELDTMFFRTTYAAAPSDKITEAIRRLGESMRDSFGLKKPEVNGH